jgi:hypothetical protein
MAEVDGNSPRWAGANGYNRGMLREFLFWVTATRLRLCAFILAVLLVAWAVAMLAGLID